MTAADPLLVLTTGGTIDKVYYDAKDDYAVGQTVVGELLRQARVTRPFELVALMQKDSLELTDADRSAIVDAIRARPHRQIVITHGTDTMTVTAERLAGLEGRTIVLTGALAPARFAQTDAAFNVGMAFASAQTLPAGVYLVMNGEVFRAGAVRKDLDRNCFVRC